VEGRLSFLIVMGAELFIDCTIKTLLKDAMIRRSVYIIYICIYIHNYDYCNFI